MSKCELFENIAEYVWNALVRNNRRNNNLDERGITSEHVVGKIQDYVEGNLRFSLFAQKAENEVNTGGDLELYIEDSYKQFVRVLLQAKLSDSDGHLSDLRRFSGSTGRRQYDSLIQFANRIDSKAFYLVYNGIPGYTFNGNDCKGVFNEKQYGCAIVDPYQIKKHCEENNTGTLKFNSTLHPIGKPWRYLVCCNEEDFSEYKRYTINEIDMDGHFKKLFTPPPPISFITSFGDFRSSRIEQLNERNKNEGWKPYARVVVTKNSKMKMQDRLLKLELRRP